MHQTFITLTTRPVRAGGGVSAGRRLHLDICFHNQEKTWLLERWDLGCTPSVSLVGKLSLPLRDHWPKQNK